MFVSPSRAVNLSRRGRSYNLFMACRSVHFAITKIDADRLIAAPDDATVLTIIQDEIEERWDEAWLC